MSMAKCCDCDRIFDTDDDPECFVEVGNMRRYHVTEIVCEACRDARQAENDALEELADNCRREMNEKEEP